jgi:hypothetical protein
MATLTLRKMSSFVYDLPSEYQNIIKYIAQHGFGNITNIAKFTKTSEDSPLERWAVKKRIYGTNRLQGLIDTDYLIEKIENKHRYKKQERTFYLTSKGVMASLASTPLKNNVAFNKIIQFANSITKGKNQSKFIEEFIIAQLKYFLACQYIQGVQLTWQKDSWRVYSNFLEESEFGFDIEIENEQIMSEFRKLFENYIVLRAVYHYLGGTVTTFMGNNIGLWDYIDRSNLPSVKNKEKHWKEFVFNWHVSPQPQIPISEELRRIKQSDVHQFVADQHIISKKNSLKKQLEKKLKSVY